MSNNKYYRPCFPDDMIDKEKKFVNNLAEMFRYLAKRQRELEDNLEWLQQRFANKEQELSDRYRYMTDRLLKRFFDDPNLLKEFMDEPDNNL